MLTVETTSRAAAAQQDVTKVHLLSLTHTHTHKGNTTHTHLCTPTCCQVPPEFGVQTGHGNNWGSIQNARSGVFDMTTVRNGEVKVAAGGIMKNSQR